MVDARLDSADPDRVERRLRTALAARVLVLDGALATMLQAGPDARATDVLSEREPRRVLDLHRAYLAAGADILTTNTFQGIGLGAGAADARARNATSARLARRAIDETVPAGAVDAADARFVAGAIGPPPMRTTGAPDITDGMLQVGYAEQAAGLLDGGIDFFMVETIFSPALAEAAVLGIRDALRHAGLRRPILLSVTLGRPDATTVGAVPFDQAIDALLRLDPFGIGVNCSFGQPGLETAVRRLSTLPVACVSCHPSAGLPDAEGRHPDAPDDTGACLGALADAGRLNIAGGCCGTTPSHVHAIAAAVRGLPPRPPRA
jgi:5-methyltetrahydrofolate--homocysteine methyltransferase